MRSKTTNCPVNVNCVPRSTVESPVTHVALIVVKIISIERTVPFVDFGKCKKQTPSKMMNAKEDTNTIDGFNFFESFFLERRKK